MATHQTARTQFITVGSTTFGYRRFGASSGTPLLILTHFRGVMDRFDPQLVNLLAADRQLLLVDYAGVGASTGRVATTVKDSASDIIAFLAALGVSEVDIFGFSLGGMVGQVLALNADPAVVRVRKLIVAGSRPSGGEGTALSSNNDDVLFWATGKDVTMEAFQHLFFPDTEAGIAACEAWWARIHERSAETSNEEPKTWLSNGYTDGAAGLQAQGSQLQGFYTAESSQGDEGSFDRLGELKIPVLVANGKADYMTPTINSYVLQQNAPNATLLVYPDSGHGFCFQYANHFAKFVIDWLAL